MKLHHLLYIFTLTLLLSACKVGKQQVSQESADTVFYYITSKGDTLYRADSVVQINIHRLIKDTVKIIGVGDIMLGTNFPKEKYLPADSGKKLLHYVKDILSNADVTFGNHEGVILNEGGKQKECENPDLCYLFRSPEMLAGNLAEAGFDVMSLANNHAGDFGDIGRANTMKVLDSLNIHHAGLITNPYTTFMMEGMKYGFTAFSPNVGTMSINDLESAQKIVAHLDSISDIVIVSFHGGAEGAKYQHVPRKVEMFYGEDRGNVYEFAHGLIDKGADVIFGHGPHVTRAVEVYKNRFIAYSLGNFCTYARFSLKGDNGIAPIIKVFTNGKGEFFKAEVTPIIQKGAGIPQVDSNKQVIKRLQALTKEDFPEVDIVIDDNGNITLGNGKTIGKAGL